MTTLDIHKLTPYQLYKFLDFDPNKPFSFWNRKERKTMGKPMSSLQMQKEIVRRITNKEGVDWWREYDNISTETEKSDTKRREHVENSLRRQIELTSKCAVSLDYCPINQEIIVKKNEVYLNIFKPSEYLLMKPNKEKINLKKDCPNIYRLLKNLTFNKKETKQQNKKRLNYLNNNMGINVQFPELRVAISIILSGIQGTGKNTFAEKILRKLFGESNVVVISGQVLERNFTEYLYGKKIIIANEVTDYSTSKKLINKLKQLTTDKYILVDEKYKPLIEYRNYASWFYFSNYSKPLPVEKDDRRLVMFDSETKYTTQQYIELDKHLDSELKTYAQYLWNLSVKKEQAFIPLETREKTTARTLSTPIIERVINDILIECYTTNTAVMMKDNTIYVKYGTVHTKYCEIQGPINKHRFTELLNMHRYNLSEGSSNIKIIEIPETLIKRGENERKEAEAEASYDNKLKRLDNKAQKNLSVSLKHQKLDNFNDEELKNGEWDDEL